ncbi:SAM-dependent methyltransferase [Acidihalobacter ferrooxydans]|uniref:SAM-dependent methyltransferase n=1 Tax=Acidihalobacter ferrooxydans TaxID=1765967 RepID=A0A1P8UG89_9GAMM|nr:class I SAM-dependent methyltransferase [Acidihalobacter ferrooxydans]APZ42849.1 SAM-dependent methyltransferase [Acidihalobacter ferrooxydans]
MSTATRLAIGWVEQGLVPDTVIRQGIRRLLATRLREIEAADPERSAAQTERIVAAMHASPIAALPELANEQHYEVPAAFFAEALGPRRKYSACLWSEGIDDLAAAEDAALLETCTHADLCDGQDILELGCGWGSLTLWMAERYPNARITAVSNSHSQREYILDQARHRGFANVEVVTVDMNDFATEHRFDRIVSVEMFEHMRNWPTLFERVHGWLRDGGKFFMHIFVHRSTPYFFEDEGDDDWMSRHFFSGGLMPSDALPLRFQGNLRLQRQWRWDGRHYERTLNAWLALTDSRRAHIMPILEATYGAQEAAAWLQRWRIFFMACAELFGYEQGRQWWVSHYLFERPA